MTYGIWFLGIIGYTVIIGHLCYMIGNDKGFAQAETILERYRLLILDYEKEIESIKGDR